MTTHQISLSMSMGASIARFAGIRQLDRVYGRDRVFRRHDGATSLKRLIDDIEAGQIDVVVVYKVGRARSPILPSLSTSLTAATFRSRLVIKFNLSKIRFLLLRLLKFIYRSRGQQ
jgi:DNA invertase Pin-like site-specific DNA recombinase